MQIKMVKYNEEQTRLLLKCLRLIRRGIKFSKSVVAKPEPESNEEANKLMVSLKHIIYHLNRLITRFDFGFLIG